MSNNKSVKEQVQEKHKEFAAEVDGLSDTALRARIVSLQQALAESEEHKEANEALVAARAEVNELVGPYNDVKKAVKLKTKYILDLIAAKGKEGN